ncbi:hypothetical protein [Natrinema salinisoli]|uniref:hypothetical protein n=1 Tax=Natrinema salinisoli TaxID=2878535 RepID=UPI001CEFDB17|nr:hypothetical protein [Natrinema salinisoli]
MLEDDIDLFWEPPIEKKIVSVFNRTALGVATIFGAWHIWNQNWWPVSLIFFMMFPAHFLAYWITDTP